LTKRICLMGSAPSSVALAPFNDPSYEIWACSPATRPFLKRVDRFFEIHLYEPDQPWFSPEYVDFMAKLPVPVFMLEPVPSIPGSVAYPKEEVMRYFGPEAIFFWTSSLSWMFAMAIIEIERSGEPGEICLFGVDMSASEEVYSGQRAGCQYFAGQALRRGIRVSVPGQSDLLRPTPLYGFCEQDTMHQKLLARKAELEARLNAVNINLQNMTAERTYLMGALEDVNYVKMTFVADPLAMEMLKAFGQSPEPLLRPIVASEAIPENHAEIMAEITAEREPSTSFNPVNDLIAGQGTASLWASTPAPNFVNGLGA
jgi:hypothetical protein